MQEYLSDEIKRDRLVWLGDVHPEVMTINNRDFYLYNGDLEYLQDQQNYLTDLIHQIKTKINPNGKEILDGGRFLDRPTSENPDVIHSGLQALMLFTMEAGKDIAEWLNDNELEKTCLESISLLEKHQPSSHNNKQAASLLDLAGILSPEDATRVLLKDGVNDFATFYGYYMLKALAKDGKYNEAMEFFSDY